MSKLVKKDAPKKSHSSQNLQKWKLSKPNFTTKWGGKTINKAKLESNENLLLIITPNHLKALTLTNESGLKSLISNEC